MNKSQGTILKMDTKKIIALTLITILTPMTTKARSSFSGSNGGFHSSSSIYSRSSSSTWGTHTGSSSNSGFSHIQRATINGRPSGVGRIYTSNGKYRNVVTSDGSRLVVKNKNGIEVDGQSWKPDPVRMVRAQVIGGRPTIYWQQPTRIVQRGRVMELNNGPRVLARPVYYRSARDIYHDDFFVGCWMRPWDPFCRPFGFFGFGTGYYSNPFNSWNPVYSNNFSSWADPVSSPQPFPTPTPEPDMETSLATANQIIQCTYYDNTGEMVHANVRTGEGGSCPNGSNPPKDMNFPNPVVFCTYQESPESDSPTITVPIAKSTCDIATPPSPTPTELITDGEDSNSNSDDKDNDGN